MSFCQGCADLIRDLAQAKAENRKLIENITEYVWRVADAEAALEQEKLATAAARGLHQGAVQVVGQLEDTLAERERVIEKLKTAAAAGRLFHEISDAMKWAGVGGLVRQKVLVRLASPHPRDTALTPPQVEKPKVKRSLECDCNCHLMALKPCRRCGPDCYAEEQKSAKGDQ